MIPVQRCGSCGFDFLNHDAEVIQHEALCKHYGVLTPREIRDLRKRHGLTLAALAQLTGLGEASLGRWENGILIQTIANDRYLRLLSLPGGIDALRSVSQQIQRQKEITDAPTDDRLQCIGETVELRQQRAIFELFKEGA